MNMTNVLSAEKLNRYINNQGLRLYNYLKKNVFKMIDLSFDEDRKEKQL